MTDSGRSFAHRLRHVFGDVFSLAYLALCAALFVWALVASALDDTGESMAGVIPLLATAPVSLVLLLLPGGFASVVVAIVVGALVNAAVIGWCARALRRGGRPDPTA